MAQGQGWRMAQGRERQLANRPTSPGAPSTVIAPPTHHSPLVEGAITFRALCAVAGWLVGAPGGLGAAHAPGAGLRALGLHGGKPLHSDSSPHPPPPQPHPPHQQVDAPAAADVFELQCVFLPHPKAPAFGAAAEGLKGTVVEAAGRWRSMVTPWAQHTSAATAPSRRPPSGAPEAPRGVPEPPPCVPGACSEAPGPQVPSR